MRGIERAAVEVMGGRIPPLILGFVFLDSFLWIKKGTDGTIGGLSTHVIVFLKRPRWTPPPRTDRGFPPGKTDHVPHPRLFDSPSESVTWVPWDGRLLGRIEGCPPWRISRHGSRECMPGGSSPLDPVTWVCTHVPLFLRRDVGPTRGDPPPFHPDANPRFVRGWRALVVLPTSA